MFLHFRRYEDSDEDDEDDDAMPTQQLRVQSRQLSDGSNPLVQIFSAISNILMNSAANAAQKSGAQLIGFDRNEALKGDNGSDEDNDDVTEGVTETAPGNCKTPLQIKMK